MDLAFPSPRCYAVAMPDIVLSTLNAKYIHAAFGLRYLFANLGDLQSRAVIAEFDINQRPLDIAESLLARNPRIIGLGVYIWNAAKTTELLAAIKRIRPDVIVILGGPEVSYETDLQEIVQLADHVITGEADLEFARVCAELLGLGGADSPLPAGPHACSNTPCLDKIIPAPLPELSQLKLPYEGYTDADIAHRVIYVEASRGCPFSCEFCLSSLDIPVRQAPLTEFLAAMQRLLDRGATQLKFVDRTFNLHLPASVAILEFCLKNCRPGRLFHFELVPDRLPGVLREVIAKFPPGSLQFEVGVQTFDEPTAERIRRRQDYASLEENFRWLRNNTGVHLHADLIVGLPGESFESFGRGFDRLVALGPQEIQVGILKRLRGTPIIRHDAEWKAVYNPHPPYELLQNRLLDFATMQRLRRFARYWDLVGNSGNFIETRQLLWQRDNSPFHSFFKWSDWLFARIGRTESIALARLAEMLFMYLSEKEAIASSEVAEVLWRDYRRGGRFDQPEFLRPHLTHLPPGDTSPRRTPRSQKRQARHLA
jgi:radical SAM superfamily enzyme YgiQ (UPF0313 family)